MRIRNHNPSRITPSPDSVTNAPAILPIVTDTTLISMSAAVYFGPQDFTTRSNVYTRGCFITADPRSVFGTTMTNCR